MFQDTFSNLQIAAASFFQNLPLALELLAILWIIQIINWLLRYHLNIFGIYPRHPWGLIGIFASPFLHGSFEHLLFNSTPFVILSSLMLIAGEKVFFCATLLIMLISGFLAWLLGRRARHVGASAVIIGYWSYLLLDAYHQRSFVAIGLAIICLYYFAGFIFSMMPGQEKVSWEGHFFGFLAGLMANYLTPYFVLNI